MAQMRFLAVLSVASCIFVLPARRSTKSGSEINEEWGEDFFEYFQSGSGSNDKSVDTGGPVSYTELAHATATYISQAEKSVQVSFGQRSARLTRDGIDATAFKDVQWLQPDSSGLNDADKKYIDDYTGRFDYSRNVGVVLRGITPYTNGEDPANKYKETKDHAKLTLEVLKWTVGFGAAMNKLPDLTQARPLWRGAWEKSDHVRRMQKLPRAYSVPWFQPMSSDQSYAPKFLGEKYAPNTCKDKDGGCIKTGASFPVLYQFTTSVGKDLTHWNPAESEFMMLPNTAFKIVSVTKIVNDKFQEMDSPALVEWLGRSDHRSINPKGGDEDEQLGPFPELAAAVRERGWDGPRFIDEYASGYLVGPKSQYDYHLKYLVHLGIDDENYPSKKQSQLTVALRNRFKLPPLKAEQYGGFVANSVPFYYEIVGESQ